MNKPLLKTTLTVSIIITVNILLAAIFFKSKANGQIVYADPIEKTIQVLNRLTTTKPNRSVYGYLPHWMLENSKYIEYDKITDIAYFGLILDQYGNFKKVVDGEEEQGYYKWKNSKLLKNVILNSKRNNVRFALTVVLQNDQEIDSFLNCPTCWQRALENIKYELKSNGLTDVNVDFEHVKETNDVISNQYTQFIELLNRELDAEFKDSKVIVASFADSYIRNRITKPKDLAKVSDGIFIMAYDFYQTTSENAGPVAPIYTYETKSYDVKKSIEDYLEEVSPYKLILGVPYYGYNFLIESDDPNAKRINGNDVLGYSISQMYSMIKDNPKIPLEKAVWNEQTQTPYVIYKSQDSDVARVLHYENEKSLKQKFILAKEKNLAGVGIWALGYDGEYKDFWNAIKSEFSY